MEHVIMMHAKDNIAIVMAPSLAVGSEFTVGSMKIQVAAADVALGRIDFEYMVE